MFKIALATILGSVVSASTQEQEFNHDETFLRAANLVVNPVSSIPQEIVNMYKGKHHDGPMSEEKHGGSNKTNYLKYLDPARYFGPNWYSDYQRLRKLQLYFYQECPNVIPMEDFDLDKYIQKRWYLTNEMYNSEEFFDYDQGKCDYHELYMNEDETLTLKFESDGYDQQKYDQHRKHLIGYAEQETRGTSTDYSRYSQDMTVRLDRARWYESNAKYQVLDTDYETYAIVYSCYAPWITGYASQNMWIFTSEPLDYTKPELYQPFYKAIRGKLMQKFEGPNVESEVDQLMNMIGKPIKFPNNPHEKCHVFGKLQGK